MGTRSLTHVLSEDGTTLLTIYRQMDGYPSGMGEDLIAFLRGRVVVNGYNFTTPKNASNGMGCLAASLVRRLKKGIGSIYITKPGAEDEGEEYTYVVYLGDNVLKLRVLKDFDVIFDGTPNDWPKWKRTSRNYS